MMNIEQLKLDIRNVLLRFPDLAEDTEFLEDTLEGATTIKETLTALLHEVDENKFMTDGIDRRLGELSERKARFVRRVEMVREMILAVMQAANMKKIELSEATLSQRASQPALIGEGDPETLPDEFVRVRRELNRTAIRDALKDGREVPGFYLNNSPPGLTVRAR